MSHAEQSEQTGPAEQAAAPTVSTAPAAAPQHRWWSSIPSHLGRARTSTAAMSVLFLGIFFLYLQVKPPAPGTPATGNTSVEEPAAPTTTEPEVPTTEPAPTTDEDEAPTTGTPAPTTGSSEPTTEPAPEPTEEPQEPAPTTTPEDSTPGGAGSSGDQGSSTTVSPSG